MSVLVSRKLVPLVALLLLLVLPFLWARTPSSPLAAPTTSTSKILEINDHVLTVYRGGATNVQDILPNEQHRGVGIDGGARVASTHGMHLAGNPFGSACVACADSSRPMHSSRIVGGDLVFTMACIADLDKDGMPEVAYPIVSFDPERVDGVCVVRRPGGRDVWPVDMDGIPLDIDGVVLNGRGRLAVSTPSETALIGPEGTLWRRSFGAAEILGQVPVEDSLWVLLHSESSFQAVRVRILNGAIDEVVEIASASEEVQLLLANEDWLYWGIVSASGVVSVCGRGPGGRSWRAPIVEGVGADTAIDADWMGRGRINVVTPLGSADIEALTGAVLERRPARGAYSVHSIQVESGARFNAIGSMAIGGPGLLRRDYSRLAVWGGERRLYSWDFGYFPVEFQLWGGARWRLSSCSESTGRAPGLL